MYTQHIKISVAEIGEYSYPWMGMTPVTLTANEVQEYGLPDDIRGVYVNSLERDGPAHEAGLKAAVLNEFDELELGDIITAINGNPMKTADQFNLFLEEKTSVGETVLLDVYKDGTMVEIPVTLE